MNKLGVLSKYFILIIFLTNISCSTNRKEEKFIDKSVDEIYNSAMRYMESNKFNQASKEFEEVERQHPYSIWATRAQLMSAYVKYKLNDYYTAIASANRYIELHPSANDIDYALSEAQTTYGLIGVKVWICRGEIYGKRDLSPTVGMTNASKGKGKPARRK